MNWTKEIIQERLGTIMAQIPANLKKNVVKEVKKTPTMEMVMNKAVTMKEIPEEKRKQIQTLIDNGEFSKTKVVEDPRIAKMIDNFVVRKISELRKSGGLPSKAEMKKLGFDKLN